MTERKLSAEEYIAVFLDASFEDIAQQLDNICDERSITSDEISKIIERWGNFISYYSDWVREVWEPAENK